MKKAERIVDGIFCKLDELENELEGFADYDIAKKNLDDIELLLCGIRSLVNENNKDM